MSATDLPRLSTGDPALDRVLGGGLPVGSSVLVTGPSGAGKTILSMQLAMGRARDGGTVLHVTTFGESQVGLLRHMSTMSFFDASLFGEKVVPLSLADLAVGVDSLGPVVDEVSREAVRLDADMVVLDSVRALASRFAPAEARQRLLELGARLGRLGTTLVLVGESDGPNQLPEEAAVNVVLEMDNTAVGPVDRRSLRVAKLRGSGFLSGRHALVLDGDGVQVHPRLESMVDVAPGQPSGERRSLGVEGLDQHVGGGLPTGDATLVMGASGTGKTVLSLHFVAAGVAAGERVLHVSLEEAVDALTAKWRAFGLGLDDARERGDYELLQAPITELDIDVLASQIADALDRVQPDRVVVDSLGEVATGAQREGRDPGYLWAMANLIRSRGATVMFTQEIRADRGLTSAQGLSHLFHNVLLLRYVELEQGLARGLTVHKMRDSAHSTRLIGLDIDDGGMRATGPLDLHGGLLGWSALRASAAVDA